MAECNVGVVSNNTNTQNESDSSTRDDQTQRENTEKVMAQYLLEDYELYNPPKSLLNLFDYFKTKEIDLDCYDTFVIFLYILTLETGFVPKDFLHACGDDSYDFSHSRVVTMTELFPENWKGDKTYFFDFVLPKCPSHVCQLFCLISDGDVLVSFRLQDDLIGYSHLFDPKAYIVNTTVKNSRHFQQLKSLSMQFKNKISFPVKTTILSMHNVQHNSLVFLPFELVVIILSKLQESDIKSVGRTCRRFARVLEDGKVQEVISKRRRSFDKKLARVRSN